MILRDNWQTSLRADRVYTDLERERETMILRDNWLTSLRADRVYTDLERVSLSEFSMGIQEFPLTPEEGINSRANAAPFKGFGERLSPVSP
jgi:hypothetical protein